MKTAENFPHTIIVQIEDGIASHHMERLFFCERWYFQHFKDSVNTVLNFDVSSDESHD